MDQSSRHPAGGRCCQEAESIVVFSAIMFATTGQAGDGTLGRSNPVQRTSAISALVEKFSLNPGARERDVVTAGFAWDPEVATGLPPLGSVGGNCPASRAVLCDKMSQLMAKGSLHFAG